MTRMPDFIGVGPPRTATTWLDKVMRGHVGLPLNVKETHFFTRNYGQGLMWYASHFRHCAAQPVVGEIGAGYFGNPQARERIRTHVPNCKIICTLRDPVEWLYSYYRLMRRNGRTELPFEEALVRHEEMMASSRYAFHIRSWQMDFGEQNVLVVLNDDLAADPQAYLDSITGFIGIRKIVVETATKAYMIEVAPRSARLARRARQFKIWLGSHRLYRTRRLLAKAGIWRFCFRGGPPFPPLDPLVRWRLREVLRPEVEMLEDLLHRDLSKWKNSTTAAPPAPSSETIQAELRPTSRQCLTP
jgi:hypothetical protein